ETERGEPGRLPVPVMRGHQHRAASCLARRTQVRRTDDLDLQIGQETVEMVVLDDQPHEFSPDGANEAAALDRGAVGADQGHIRLRPPAETGGGQSQSPAERRADGGQPPDRCRPGDPAEPAPQRREQPIACPATDAPSAAGPAPRHREAARVSTRKRQATSSAAVTVPQMTATTSPRSSWPAGPVSIQPSGIISMKKLAI